MTPERRAWLRQERDWGALAARAIERRAQELHPGDAGLERFGVRMALVELTGAVARWAHGLVDGLTRAGRADTAAAFAGAPPFAATEPTRADCERLREYVHTRVELLNTVLAEDP